MTDRNKVKELARSYYDIKHGDSGWSQHRASIVSKIVRIFKANNVVEGHYNLTPKSYFYYSVGGKNSFPWGQVKDLRDKQERIEQMKAKFKEEKVDKLQAYADKQGITVEEAKN
jgi:hypothetical protein